MKRKTLKFLAGLLSIMLIIPFISTIKFNVNAESNPYGKYQTISGVTTVRCTWYAWQQAYDNTGVALPNFGNAKNWYSSAQNSGYSVGEIARENSIAVWTNSGYGHVAYVVSVNGSTMYVNEGGMTNTDGSAYNGDGIINGSKCNSTVGSKKSNYSSSILVGFIYLNASDVTLECLKDKNTIEETNAVLWGQVNKPSSYAVTEIGIFIRKKSDTYANGWSKFETPSKNYVGSTYMQPYFNMNSELGLTLTAGTEYCYQFYAVVNGKEYYSSEETIKTNGTHNHSYGAWNTVTAATCTSAGSRKRVCSCGDTQTETIPATGHTPGDWIIDREAQIGVAGSKHRECTVCHTMLETETIPSLEKPVTPPDETAPQIIIGSKKVRPGGMVDVNIALKNNPGIASLKLKVSFDSDLTLTNITYNDSIGGSSQLPQTMDSPVILNWYNGAANSNGDFTFVTLTFNVAETAQVGYKNITLSYDPDDVYNIDENNIEFAVIDGNIEVISYIPGDINGDDKVNNKDLTRLFQYLSNWDVEVNEAVLDVNGDGKVNNKDLTRLFQYLSNWDVEIF